MITDAILDFILRLAKLATDNIDPVSVPNWVGTAAQFASSVFGFSYEMGAWFDPGLAINIILTLLATWLGSFITKLTRIAMSFFSGGGGSAS